MAAISGTSPNTFPTPASTTPKAVPAASAASASGEVASKNLNQTFDQFLLLLTTQLKNQDPMSPMDSAQFTNQLVSFSQVEQQIKTNSNLSQLVNLTKTSQTTLGLSFIGLNVDINGEQFEYGGDGAVVTNYSLPSASSITSLSVIDENGNSVYTQKGDTASGKHTFTWNGKDNNGQQLPAGVYKLRVGALDKDQKNITVNTVVPGHVTGITTADDGSINLIVGVQAPQVIPLGSVTQATL